MASPNSLTSTLTAVHGVDEIPAIILQDHKESMSLKPLVVLDFSVSKAGQTWVHAVQGNGAPMVFLILSRYFRASCFMRQMYRYSPGINSYESGFPITESPMV